MRHSALSILIAGIGLLALGAPEAQAQATRCRTSNCFNEHDVRDFEVLGDDTMVVYVGRNRCPFLIKVDSLYCNLRFVPDVAFIKTRGRTDNRTSTRVCTYEMGVGLDTFGFGVLDPQSDRGSSAMVSQDMACRIREFRAMSDDEILELYVEEGIVAPPPPIGTGQISRSSGQDDDAAADEEAGSREAETEQG